jgi:hypothetical protein
MIRWTPGEVNILAKAFLDARIRDMFAPVSMLLEEAEKSLPEHRRRGVKALTLLSFDAQQEIKNMAKEFGRRHFEPAVAGQERPPTPETKVEAEMPPVKPVKEEAREPFVIEFRIPKSEKPDLAKLLADVPTPVLYGFALDRLLKSGVGFPTFASAPRPVPDVVRVETQTLPPEPVVIKENEVVDPTPADDGRRRVLVLGLLPSAQAIAKEKCKNFLKLDITFADSNTRVLPAVVVDYALLMRGIINSFQADQIRKRFATKDRVIYCDLGLDDVMSKLADINSRP